MHATDKTNDVHNNLGNVSQVVHVAWPIVISMLSFTAMDVCDTLFVGWIGKTELAAVGLATVALFLLNSFFLGTMRGVNILGAQATGAGRPARAIQIGFMGALLAVPFGLVVVGASLFDEQIFALLGGSPQVQSIARDYFGVRALGTAFWYVTLALAGYFQSTGDTRTPMYVNLLANGLNIALDPLLIFGLGPIPALGVEGAAIATIIAQAAGMLAILPIFIVRTGIHHRVDLEAARSILRVGVPVGVHFATGVGAFVVFTSFLARMGEDELAAHMIALKIISVSFLPGRGVSDAACILVGQFVGANDLASARRAFRSALKLTLVVMGSCALVFWLFPEPLVLAFNRDPNTVAIACKLLVIAAIFQIFDATAMVSSGALNGTGDTQFTMWTSIVCGWFILVPLAYAFAFVLGWGATGAWLALVVEMAVVALITTARFVGNGWQRTP
ncbi:MAG: MATE family efflux transporter [Bradymonadaceae bacterium]|nr:MATE family efflux transporter [Lujinxingiaceae bacterium]